MSKSYRISKRMTEEDWGARGFAVTEEVAGRIGRALRKIEDHDDAITRFGLVLRRTLDRVDSNLASGYHLNSLGELQSDAREYDRHVALRHEAIEHFLEVADILRVDSTEILTAFYAEEVN